MQQPSVYLAPALTTRVLFRVFEAMACGCILLDAQKRIIVLNERAQTGMGESLTIKNGRLCAADRISDALFQTALDQHLKYANDPKWRRREAVGLRRQDKQAVIVRVVPVEIEAQADLDHAALVLIVVDPEDGPEPSHTFLQQVFGLTKTEARVAGRLARGETLQEIADDTGVAVGTVRAQVKSIFAKTGTNRQPELAVLLTRLAMISEEAGEDRSGSGVLGEPHG